MYSAYHYFVYCGPPISIQMRTRVAMLKLEKTKELIEKQITIREHKIERKQRDAMDALNKKNKQQALAMIKLSKLYSSQADKYRNIHFNIVLQMESIIEGETFSTVFETLKAGNEESDRLLNSLDIDRLEDVNQKAQENIDDMDRASSSLAKEFLTDSSVDEEELLIELETLQKDVKIHSFPEIPQSAQLPRKERARKTKLRS
jgi:Snf7 protein